ncbi:MAG: TIGR01212 family radical SAM protein [Candidatus Omnitrophica bacterium]|nr:TIGR01212 family radical SAM protein [Candidatus Omnitrophota bacterium]
MERYYSFNRYLKSIFGSRVHRIGINAGFSCPNIDGTLSDDGCSYCNNKAFGVYVRCDAEIKKQIEESISFYKQRMGVNQFIAYFQSFSNTYADLDRLKQAYNVVRSFPEIAGICISTRPDCVDEDKIRMISQYKKDYLVWIEYGLQTTSNKMLRAINRNHTYEDFLFSLNLTRKYKINAGVHMILGLPKATHQDMMTDCHNLAKLDLQGIKFHVLHVSKNTSLEKAYNKGEVRLMTEAEYISVVCDFLECLPPTIAILRLASTAFKDYLIAPSWTSNKSVVIEGIRRELVKRNTHQGCKL